MTTAQRGACFVCQYAPTACDRDALFGEVLSLEPELQGATLQLRQSNGKPATLLLRPPWHRLVGDLEQHGLRIGTQARSLSLAAYHLQRAPKADRGWLAGPDSLVVLEPEWLEDVTSLTRTQYCERHYLIPRFQTEPVNEAILKGTLAHTVFRAVLAQPADNDLLRRALDQALLASAAVLAALELDPDAARQQVLPGLRNLVRWARGQVPPGQPSSETFILAHRLGLRGRIDAVWTENGSVGTVAELKVGQTWQGRARPEHELQVAAYGLMLAERGAARPREERLLLLYAENLGSDGRPDLVREVPFRTRTFANLIHFRNRLVLIDLTGRANYAATSRCRPCRHKQTCHRLTELLEAPRCASGCVLEAACPGRTEYSSAERVFFRHWVELLNAEWRALQDATARLWRTAPQERCADGSAAAIRASHPISDPEPPAVKREPGKPQLGHRYRLELENDCELRVGDRVLLSDARGPANGQVAQVEVEAADELALEVVASEPLRFSPIWVDQYSSERLFLQAYAGLYGWLTEPPARRALAIEPRPPRFGAGDQTVRRHLPGGRQLNARQTEALELALRAEEYLLVQGPPGSGKTELIAALARELTDRERRVLLLAATNRALDRLLQACARLGLEERLVRLGGRAEPGSVGERRLLSRLASDHNLEANVARARALLDAPIVASTLSTLAAGPFAGRGFDTVVLDEASQVTLPAALGAVRHGRRFVLVGDHRQLPPVVQTGRPGEPGLGESLFETLARANESADRPGLVLLDEQYRMNAEICGFPSRRWYSGRLRPAAEVAARRLDWSRAMDDDSAEADLLAAMLDPDHPIVFVDVPGSEVSAPRTNRREARLAARLAELAWRRGLPRSELAIITPFRAQVALIRSLLGRGGDVQVSEAGSELVDTVDRFQGSERACVIYSCATSGPELHPLLLDERRLNVALTRAQSRLIVLGDLRVLRTQPAFAELAEYCTSLYSDGGGLLRWP